MGENLMTTSSSIADAVYIGCCSARSLRSFSRRSSLRQLKAISVGVRSSYVIVLSSFSVGRAVMFPFAISRMSSCILLNAQLGNLVLRSKASFSSSSVVSFKQLSEICLKNTEKMFTNFRSR